MLKAQTDVKETDQHALLFKDLLLVLRSSLLSKVNRASGYVSFQQMRNAVRVIYIYIYLYIIWVPREYRVIYNYIHSQGASGIQTSGLQM